MDYVKGHDCHQLQFRCPDDLVPKAYWVRVVDRFADVLFNYGKRAKHEAKELLKVYYFATLRSMTHHIVEIAIDFFAFLHAPSNNTVYIYSVVKGLLCRLPLATF